MNLFNLIQKAMVLPRHVYNLIIKLRKLENAKGSIREILKEEIAKQLIILHNTYNEFIKDVMETIFGPNKLIETTTVVESEEDRGESKGKIN